MDKEQKTAPPAGMFRVIWKNVVSGWDFFMDIEAGTFAEAAWQVACAVSDAEHPDNLELQDVVRLS